MHRGELAVLRGRLYSSLPSFTSLFLYALPGILDACYSLSTECRQSVAYSSSWTALGFGGVFFLFGLTHRVNVFMNNAFHVQRFHE